MSELVAGQADHAVLNEQRMSAAVATGTWFCLVVMTIAAWLLARGGFENLRDRSIELTIIVVLAAIKIYLVLDIFMGLRCGPIGWRIAIVSWLLGTCGAVLFFVLRP